MQPILFGKLDPSKAAHCKYDGASSGAVADRSDRSTLDAGAPERASDGVQEALESFGVPRRDPRGKKAYAERWHKSLGPRKQVTGPRGYSGTAPPIANLAPDDWRPRNVCSMSMDKALREMEFPSRLAGAEWVLE